jgi:hypothetical protein
MSLFLLPLFKTFFFAVRPTINLASRGSIKLEIDANDLMASKGNHFFRLALHACLKVCTIQ